MDEDVVPVSLQIPVPDAPPPGGLASGSAHAGASASASVPDPSNEHIFELVQHFFVTTEHVQSQMGKIDILAKKMSEMAINQSNMSAQVAGMEGRIDTIDSRLIKLDEGNKDAPVSQAHPSTNAWGDMPCAPAASTSTLPAPAPLPNTPKVYSHWDRPMDPTILRISTNKHKVALGAVGDAFAYFWRRSMCLMTGSQLMGQTLAATLPWNSWGQFLRPPSGSRESFVQLRRMMGLLQNISNS